MDIRTKIICTMGPSVNSYEKIVELIDAGMNVARLNFSHGTHDNHLQVIKLLRRAREEKGVPLGIMLDTKGPEIRIGKMKGGFIPITAGQRLWLVKDAVEGDGERVQLTPPQVFGSVKEGIKILIDDGYLVANVIEHKESGILIEFENAGTLKSQKGVNIPSARIDLPAMTKQDVEDISFGCANDIDIIAASFIRSAQHVTEIKKLLIANGRPEVLVIAKIESPEGVENFDSIVLAADGIMVARGDLGVELPLEQVPSLQKMMIDRSLISAKIVVTATQMLESMIKNPRPTRAEVSDVANAIYDSTTAVMLSGETAVGLYPVEAVKIMKRIIKEAEGNISYTSFSMREEEEGGTDVSLAVAIGSVRTACHLGARAIFAFTSSGLTARLISRARPAMPILALSSNYKTFHQLSLCWGVMPVDPQQALNVREAFTMVSEFAMQRKIVSYGDLVVITAGSPFGISGTTNIMLVESIGDVLVRGKPGYGNTIHGRVVPLYAHDDKTASETKDKIVILSSCSEKYLPLLEGAVGIVLQSRSGDSASEKWALKIARELGISVITRAKGALTQLKEGQLVTLDPSKGIIYKGSIPADS